MQHVAVELRGDALGVVVGGLQHVRVLDEIGAHQQVVAGSQQAGDLAQKTAAAAGREIADRAAEEDHQARAGRGWYAVEMTLEVTDDTVHAQTGILGGQLVARIRAPSLGDIDGHVAL